MQARPVPLCRHPGEQVERAGLAGCLDDRLDGLEPERPDQLVLEVVGAPEEAESLRVVVLQGRQAGRREPTPELVLVGGVVQAGELYAEPARAVAGRERPGVGDAAHRDDLDAVAGEVQSPARRHGLQCHPVAVALDEYDGAGSAHPTIGARAGRSGQPDCRQ